MTVIIRTGATDTNSINVLYENILESGTLSFSTEAVGFVAANVLDDATWNAWQPTAVPAFLQVDMGSPVTCDTLGISSHNMGTAGASFILEYSADGISWTESSASYAALDDGDILVCFQSASARYWRINLTGAVAFIGVVKLGEKLAFPYAPLEGHVALHHSRKYELLTNGSMSGQFFASRVVKVGAETSVNVGIVDRDFAETDLAAFELHYNQGRAFFYCGAPSDIPNDMGFCKRPDGSQEMAVIWVEGDVMAEVSFDVSSYVPA